MNTHEELTKMLMESYDKGVEDAMQAALEGIQKAILLEREACAELCHWVVAEPGADVGTALMCVEKIRARGNT